MKVYVASKAENYPEVRLVMRALEDAGHTITHDWTVQVETAGPMPQNIVYRRECAHQDEQGVRECDVFVLIMHKGVTGALIEFGMALALDKRVFIIADLENLPVETIFLDSTEITWHSPSMFAIINVVKFCDHVQMSQTDGTDDVEDDVEDDW